MKKKSISKFVNRFGSTKRAIASNLRATARAIEKYGFVKGYFGDESVGFCTIGAMRYATGYNHQSTREVLAKHLRLRSGVPQWNDKTDQTKENVLRTLRRLAAKLEHGGTVR